MYENIAGISIKGKCFENESKLNLFSTKNERISIIYGKNGSGKSTIAEAFSAYKRGDTTDFNNLELYNFQNSTVQLLDEDKKNIFIFDEKYIENKIRLKEDGLNTIVMFGDQVNLDKQIKILEAEIKKCEEIKKKQEEICENFKDLANPLSPKYHYEEIKEKLKTGGWAETDSKIKGTRRNTSVTDAVLEEIVNINLSKAKTELQAEFDKKYSLFKQIRDGQERITDEIKPISIDKDIDMKVLSLLSKTIEKPVLTEREKKILDVALNGYQKRIETSKEIFSNKDTTLCPYCYQPVDEEYKEDLIKSIDKVLNKDVDKHKEELKNLTINKIVFDETKYSKLDRNQCEKIKKEIKICNDIIDEYNAKIEEKCSNIYNSIKIVNLKLVEHVDNLNQELEQLEKSRIDFNKMIDEKEHIKTELINLNKQIACYEVQKKYNQYKTQIQKKEKEDNKFIQIKENIEKKKKYLEDLKQKKKSIKIAQEYINKALEYVFFCKGRLTIEAKKDTYYLKSYGNPVKPSDISTGERNIIALSYFFTEILNNMDEKNAYKEKYLLVIDDPISSFDLENKIGIHSFLKYQIQKILLGNKESKIILLSHDLGVVYDFIKAAKEIKESVKEFYKADITKFAIWELKDKSMKKNDERSFRDRHEYTYLMEMIYKYAIEEDVQKNELIIGNVMRRLLEAFSTFQYKKSIDKISCDKKILSLLNDNDYVDYFENLMYRLILHGESHFEERVKILSDMNFFSCISLDEKVRTAKDILCFMFLLNQKHIESHLSGIAGAIENIKNWCNNILSEKKHVG